MEQRRPPEYTLELVADRSSLRDVVKGILHMIFFHRYFTPLYPATHEVLDLTLPYVSEDEVETLIEARTTSLLRHFDSPTSPSRGHLALHFLEKKRKKGLWFVAKADEETIWETWIVDVTLIAGRADGATRKQMERSLHKAAMKIINMVGLERGHIPPITTNESNPFPFQIAVNPKIDGWGQRMGGIF